MTSVFEELYLERAYPSARYALKGVLESIMSDGRVLRLYADLGPAKLSKAVLITFRSAEDPTRFDEVWSTRWTPENGGPFPEFMGSLSIRCTSGGLAKLELDGQYAPPFGPLGKGFDLAFGQRIASKTCKNLLLDLAARIERHTQAQEV